MSDRDTPFFIIGHRGAAGERLENSLEGFHHALALDIDAVELDIHEHSGRLWVFHDDELERLTDSTGLLNDHPDPAAIRLDNGEPLPLLPQVLDLYWGRMPLNIEAKSVQNPQLLLDMLATYGPLPESPGLPWILISSFNHGTLRELRQLGCPWPLAPLNDAIPQAVDTELARLEPWSWHFDDACLDFNQLRYLRERGVPSLVYTVNDPARAAYLKENGVAGIFTDVPTKMRATL